MTERAGAPARPRRFYQAVGVQPADAGFAVQLDGRGARTPGGRLLALPTRPLAELVAEEWAAQRDTIDYAGMAATRLAHTAVDAVSVRRSETIEAVTRYAADDLLCYFATDPDSLVARQRAGWGPLLEWSRETLGLTFAATSGVIHRYQNPAVLESVAAAAADCDDHALAGLAFGAALFGSAILSFALRDGRLNAKEATAAARLDELFQEERWGVDREAADRAARLASDATMLERWFRALA